MSLTQEVTDLVNELGEVSGDALLPYLPEYSREKVFQALQNARYTKKIRLVRRGRALGPRNSKGSLPGVYGPLEEVPAPVVVEPKIRPVSSVWEMGDRAMGLIETHRRYTA